MIKNRNKLIGLLLVTLLIFSACSKYSKLLKSTDYELKYKEAIKYYEEKEYLKAIGLFEELIPIYKGTSKAEKVYYYYAYCHYGQEDYIMAGYYFSSFSKTFPNSNHSEEAEFLAAYCYYMDSPKSSLDQSNTYKAIEELQLFINRHPESEKIEEANELIDKLRHKLEKKSYDNALLYFNIGNFKASIFSINTSLKEFPDSKYRQDLLFYKLKSSYLLAINSIESKKNERFQSTIDAYFELIDEYPNYQHKKDAEKIYENTRTKLSKK